MDSHPNLGFGWVQVSACGFKFQSEVEVSVSLYHTASLKNYLESIPSCSVHLLIVFSVIIGSHFFGSVYLSNFWSWVLSL